MLTTRPLLPISAFYLTLPLNLCFFPPAYFFKCTLSTSECHHTTGAAQRAAPCRSAAHLFMPVSCVHHTEAHDKFITRMFPDQYSFQPSRDAESMAVTSGGFLACWAPCICQWMETWWEVREHPPQCQRGDPDSLIIFPQLDPPPRFATMGLHNGCVFVCTCAWVYICLHPAGLIISRSVFTENLSHVDILDRPVLSFFSP